MGMIKRDHELFESGGYSNEIAPEVYAWREVAEDRDSEASASISMEALELSGDLDPSVNLAGEPVMLSPVIPTVGAVKTLSVFSTGSNGRSVDRRSKGVVPAIKSLLGEGEGHTSDSMLVVASPLAKTQQFRSEDLYQSNCQ
ncbi:hypothetical protein AYI68_g56 [Smittium mucronatum]|uniref:Uncharacterized protein n=1 Tax=Smittium mucronatum TaxID=133383 RepID=A0A1R0H9F3_9FUNG|nr:hypothetical protein AYI68_g56 [Smittium mucronatum]